MLFCVFKVCFGLERLLSLVTDSEGKSKVCQTVRVALIMIKNVDTQLGASFKEGKRCILPSWKVKGITRMIPGTQQTKKKKKIKGMAK